MPKDYQEIEKILEELDNFIDNTVYNECPYIVYSQLKDLVSELSTTLTTYGNARELAGIEKVEKGVPEKEQRTILDSKNSRNYAIGYNVCRQTTLDHIAKVKSELK